MSNEILKASEIPPGARLLGRQAQAMTGWELARGLGGLVEKVAGELALVACEAAIARAGWAQRHLTFPRAKVEWVPCEGGIWLRLVFGTGGAWDWEWQSGKADIREMKVVGPFGSPDDMREALSLPRVAQFKLPSGEVVTAELPTAALRQVEVDHAAIKKEVEADYAPFPAPHQIFEKEEQVMTEAMKAIERMSEGAKENAMRNLDVKVGDEGRGIVDAIKVANEPIINPLTGAPIEPQGGGFVARFTEPAVLPADELLAEPPSTAKPVPLVEPVVVKEPKFGKGSRGKKGATNGTN